MSDYKVQVFFDLYLRISQKLHLYLIGNPKCARPFAGIQNSELNIRRFQYSKKNVPYTVYRKLPAARIVKNSKKLEPYSQPEMLKLVAYWQFFADTLWSEHHVGEKIENPF